MRLLFCGNEFMVANCDLKNVIINVLVKGAASKTLKTYRS